MKTTNKMNDSQKIEAWGQVTDPVEALEEMLEHSMFIGSDPYYRDLDAALWAMAARSVETAKAQGEEK